MTETNFSFPMKIGNSIMNFRQIVLLTPYLAVRTTSVSNMEPIIGYHSPKKK